MLHTLHQKQAATGLTANTRSMHANSGIRCNGIAPGEVMTNIQQSMTCVSEFDTGRQGTRLATMPRASQPKEIVQLAFFLASGDLRFIVGQVIAAYTE